MTVTIPVLTTERLTLRAPTLPDFEVWADYYASDRSVWEDGPLPRAQAWRIWCADQAQWLLRGYGPFGVQSRADGTYLGEVGIYHRDDFPAPELGWFLRPEAEGKGYGAEAARAVLVWARAQFGWDELVNYIAPGNTRSIALALRLGGQQVDGLPGTAPDDVVIRHDLRGLA
ncbi:MAG: GNAT family N-acetyltransferase [Paracoccus sp. (in: a-proteobacteria)]|nr:GNAT family N-acetyltransferase [Paracoccus sp. (in: a-proteobacteria)]